MTREGSDQTGPSDPVNSENSNNVKNHNFTKTETLYLKNKKYNPNTVVMPKLIYIQPIKLHKVILT